MGEQQNLRGIAEPLISCAATEELPVPAVIPRSTCMLQPRPPNTISGHEAERRTNAIRLVPGTIPSFEQATNRTNNDDDVVVRIDQSQNRRLPSSFVRSCPNRARHVDERLDLAKGVVIQEFRITSMVLRLFHRLAVGRRVPGRPGQAACVLFLCLGNGTGNPRRS